MAGRKAWDSSRRGSRQSRGYGRAHEKMRERLLAEEPLCRECAKRGVIEPTTIADHIIPKAEGGTNDRKNYQGLCDRCSKAKTNAEAARAQGRRVPTPYGGDENGWPADPAHPWNQPPQGGVDRKSGADRHRTDTRPQRDR